MTSENHCQCSACHSEHSEIGSSTSGALFDLFLATIAFGEVDAGENLSFLSAFDIWDSTSLVSISVLAEYLGLGIQHPHLCLI